MATKTEKRSPGRPLKIQDKRDIRAIVARYRRGDRTRDIAADYGLHHGSIRAIVRRAGEPVRPVGRPRP